MANGSGKPKAQGITQITVCGYKSIAEEQSIEIRPLTILAGANSSGKSSMMQPLLLLKQTLEATYDPGTLLLDGPNVKFTSVDQLLSRVSGKSIPDVFYLGIKAENRVLTIHFRRHKEKGLEIVKMSFINEGKETVLRQEMTHQEIISAMPDVESRLAGITGKKEFVVVRNRCFLEIILEIGKVRYQIQDLVEFSPTNIFIPNIQRLIHLPALRGNPERAYPKTSSGPTFPGRFEHYTAGVIEQWDTQGKGEKIRKLSGDLEKLGLTLKVKVSPIDDTRVELKVGRLTHTTKAGQPDLVNIADVGFGVSQTLPILVALHAASPGQLIYIEQPEIHLHPKAQVKIAEVLADAVNSGVRMVIETHSSLFLRKIQSLVAKNEISRDLVKLHWFERTENGTTKISSRDLDEKGAFGDWPEDFGNVELETEEEYLNAAESST